jgi:hydroxymethylglutaryl-CoA reductase
MYKSRQFSPRTYNQRKEQLERWVTLEREEIQRSKKQFHEEWEKTVRMIEDTQKNVNIMREQILGHAGDAHHHPLR